MFRVFPRCLYFSEFVLFYTLLSYRLVVVFNLPCPTIFCIEVHWPLHVPINVFLFCSNKYRSQFNLNVTVSALIKLPYRVYFYRRMIFITYHGFKFSSSCSCLLVDVKTTSLFTYFEHTGSFSSGMNASIFWI